MTTDHLERLMQSANKQVRLKALAAMLRHPQASPLQLARGLCSQDNQNFEFMDEFGLLEAVHHAWDRLRGVDDEAVYAFLDGMYRSDPQREERGLVVHVLQLIGTRQALGIVLNIRDSGTPPARPFLDWLVRSMELRLAAAEGKS